MFARSLKEQMRNGNKKYNRLFTKYTTNAARQTMLRQCYVTTMYLCIFLNIKYSILKSQIAKAKESKQVEWRAMPVTVTTTHSDTFVGKTYACTS